jgi:hypothetical protein
MRKSLLTLITISLSLFACDKLDTTISRGEFSGNVAFREYLTIGDSTSPIPRSYTKRVSKELFESKEGFFIKHDGKEYFFDDLNNIEITDGNNWVKFKRTNDELDYSMREEYSRADSSFVLIGEGLLKK